MPAPRRINSPTPRQGTLRALLIIVAGYWVFAPSLHGDWLMDDDFYLTQNALLHDPHRLWKIWFAPGSLTEYYPVEATLQAVEWHFFGLHTWGYHVASLGLHLLGALLVWRLLAKFQLRSAWIGGLLFAIHPVAVESVAWISEFKNTLSLPPFLMAMICWIDFENHGRRRDYFLALGWFLFAMLCKISMALFPLIILLYAWWKRDRLRWNDLKISAPFFLVSLVLGLMTILVGNWFREAHLQSAANPDIGGLASRLALAGQSIAFYFTKCVWPVGMVPIYPQWAIHSESPLSYGPWLVIALVLALCWIRRASWGRHALLGLGFFLLNLLPFIGLNSVTYMGFTWVWDHLLYLPLVGVIGLAVASLDQIDARLPARARTWFAGGIAVVFALMAWESEVYAGVFAGPEALWTYTIARNPSSWLAHNNLGDVYLEANHVAAAIAQYEAALRANPASVEASTNLGFAYELAGRPGDAIVHYQTALRYNPHFGLAHAHLGRVLQKTGDIPGAMAHYQEALRINPNDEATRAALDRLQRP